ncbi:response regulator [Frigoribacterium faeni]|uniref:DNA-binding NarL/FixJ family response regulator n=1 Tax=Frigoribacterium faeni TaxID=145483 RepID=A0A7W3JHV8_9MICO|nr:response regulator transcription factor [Frigoribacterium faeni]MBA8813049.1 DNA-binding NarL/FixJ family response regulator [Frigoribacterium faeni]BFF14230.1 response regulator transcription factor [Microbacterium flavescens]GEK84792.1 DNA-binding response regulator [Frigoribacterium faeni]
MIRVLVVDDHPLVRAGLRALVETAGDLLVVGEATSGEDAVAAVRDSAPADAPDVVLMDLSMPGIGGLEATRLLTAAETRPHVVVLTSFPDPASVRQALAAGAVGYLLKDADPATVVAGVRAAAGGGAPLDPRAARVLLPSRDAGGAGTSAAPPASSSSPPVDPLVTGREAEVLRLIARGRANKQIAHELGISERTVKAHAGSVFRRIGVADRTSAALWARDNGF